MPENTFMTNLGAAVREARKRQGLDQEELAMAAGVSTRTLHSVENGHPTVKIDTILKIVDSLGMTIHFEDPDDG